MFSVKSVLFSMIVFGLFSSCASSYKAINPGGQSYPESSPDESLTYKYNVLRQANNKKLAKKEDKNQINIVAIRIINNTGQTLKYGQNFKIYSNNQEIDILPIPEVTQHIRQTVPTYLLYLLLTPMRFNVATETKQSSTPIGLVIGPGLAALNIGIAAGANKKFKKEMEEYNIIDREIQNGEAAYGLIGIRNTDYAPLTLKLTGK